MTSQISRHRPMVDEQGRLTQWGWTIIQALWKATGGAIEIDSDEILSLTVGPADQPAPSPGEFGPSQGESPDPFPQPYFNGQTLDDVFLQSGADVSFGDMTVTGELAHEGSTLGLYNTTPVAQPADADQAALTNSTGGTADGTLAAVGDTSAGDESGAINDNFTELHTLLNEIRTALVAIGAIKGSA